jgi:predicted secreted protein
MSIVGGILIYVNLWMIVLFTVLPLGVKNQIDSPDFQKGTDPGAPIESKMKRKVLITTIITTVIFSLIFALDKLDLFYIRKILF